MTMATVDPDGAPLAEVFLSRAEFAAMIGVEPDTLGRYRLPPADATIGNVRGWRATTVAAWDAQRPSRRHRPA